jgi:hypothetical protein
MNPVADFDFGITGLAQQFHQDWPSVGSPVEIANGYMEMQPIPYLAALADDASFMLSWNGRGNYADSIWIAGTAGYYQPRLAGMSCEGLLRHVLKECSKRLGMKVPFVVASRSPCRSNGSDVVRREIQHLHADLSDCLDRSGLETRLDGVPVAMEALHQCADSAARPELAFRFLLRLLVASSCSIAASEYVHLQEVGVRMNYGEFLVSAVEFLIAS